MILLPMVIKGVWVVRLSLQGKKAQSREPYGDRIAILSPHGSQPNSKGRR